jgi:hypothetical protein
MIELEIRWPSGEHADVPIGAPLDVLEVTGLTQAETESLLGGVSGRTRITARSSSQGKGASGAAFAVVVEVERFATDAATLIVLGSALRRLIKAVARKVNPQPVVEDPNTLGAIAAAENQDRDPFGDNELEGLRYISTVPVTAYPGSGTDARDIWATCFLTESNDAVVVFVSPSGTWLGRVRVPAEYYIDTDRQLVQRTGEEIRDWWS